MQRLLAALLALALPSLAHAATSRSGGSTSQIGSRHPFGLGLVLGAPTGVTLKYYFTPTGALEGSLATWVDGYGGYGGYYGHLVYLWHPAVLARNSSLSIPFHAGVGGFITDGEGWGWYGYHGWGHGYDYVAQGGARGVVGLDFDLVKIPLQFFVDVGVNVTVLPGLWPGGTLGTGARWYF